MTAGTVSNHRLPAEWEPHTATWLAWPHRRATWVGDFAPIPGVFAAVARLVARHEPVRMVATGAVLAAAREQLAGVANLEFVDLPTNDAWLRDTGPVFVVPRDATAAPAPASRMAARRFGSCSRHDRARAVPVPAAPTAPETARRASAVGSSERLRREAIAPSSASPAEKMP